MKTVNKKWLWFWGVSQEDAAAHSKPIEFFDFDEMKDYSAQHSADHKFIGDGYWSDYEKLEGTFTLPEKEVELAQLFDNNFDCYAESVRLTTQPITRGDEFRILREGLLWGKVGQYCTFLEGTKFRCKVRWADGHENWAECSMEYAVERGDVERVDKKPLPQYGQDVNDVMAMTKETFVKIAKSL